MLITGGTAFSPMSGTAAIGVVARNDQGVVVAALSAPISACYDVEEAEARAIFGRTPNGLRAEDQVCGAGVGQCTCCRCFERHD